jgi:hypothetical protein
LVKNIETGETVCYVSQTQAAIWEISNGS